MRRPELPPAARALLRRAREELLLARAELRRRALRLLALLWPPRAAHAALLLCAAVAGLGLRGLLEPGLLDARLPSELDWRAAAAVLARDARPGDLVAVDPGWAERARLLLPATLPVLPAPALAVEPLVGVRRIWLLTLPGAPGGRAPADALPRALEARAGPAEGIGALALARAELRAPLLAAAFLPDLAGAAELRAGGEPCGPSPAGAPSGASCGSGAAALRELREVRGAPRPCLLLRALPGEPLAVRMPPLPAGRALRGRAALVGAPREGVLLRIDAGGEPVELEVGPGADAPLELPLPPGPARVALELRAPSPVELCLDAWVAP